MFCRIPPSVFCFSPLQSPESLSAPSWAILVSFFSCGFLSCPARRSAGRHCVNFIAFADRRGFSPIPPRDNKGDLLVRRLFAFWRYRTLPVITPRDFRGKASESVDQKRGGRKQDIRKGPPWHGRKRGIGRERKERKTGVTGREIPTEKSRGRKPGLSPSGAPHAISQTVSQPSRHGTIMETPKSDVSS